MKNKKNSISIILPWNNSNFNINEYFWASNREATATKTKKYDNEIT